MKVQADLRRKIVEGLYAGRVSVGLEEVGEVSCKGKSARSIDQDSKRSIASSNRTSEKVTKKPSEIAYWDNFACE